MKAFFKSISGKKYTIQVGTSTDEEMCACDSLHLSWESTDNIYAPVRSTSASIRVITKHDLSSLYTASPLGTPVKISSTTSSCVFCGFLTPQEWKAPSGDEYSEVEIVAVDALSAIKSVPYTMSGTAPQMLKPSDFINRAISVMNDAGMDIELQRDLTLPWDEKLINEQAFLPEYFDDPIYSDDRKTWGDVFDALGTFLGVTFMIIGDELVFEAIDDVINSPSPIAISSVLRSQRSSIEPAKSKVSVSYKTSQMNLGWDIETNRMSSNAVENTSQYLYWNYYEAKDWEPTDARAVCGYIMTPLRDSSEDAESTCAIVGPAKVRASAAKVTPSNVAGTYVSFKIKMMGISAAASSSSYYYFSPSVAVSDQLVNIIKFTFSDGTVVNMRYELEADKTGFQEITRSFVPGSGSFVVEIPAGVIIESISADLEHREPFFKQSGAAHIEIYDDDDDKITSISQAYGDDLSIDAYLRPSVKAYAATDVCTLSLPQTGSSWAYSGWSKYPYCNTAQFQAPRLRKEVTTSTILSSIFFTSYKFANDTRTYIADAADFDMREETATLSLLETWKTTTT